MVINLECVNTWTQQQTRIPFESNDRTHSIAYVVGNHHFNNTLCMCNTSAPASISPSRLNNTWWEDITIWEKARTPKHNSWVLNNTKNEWYGSTWRFIADHETCLIMSYASIVQLRWSKMEKIVDASIFSRTILIIKLDALLRSKSSWSQVHPK